MHYTFKQNIKRHLIKIYQGLRVDRLLMKSGIFDTRIDRAIKRFAITPFDKDNLKKDIRESYVRYLTTPEEYFFFGFQGKDDTYRRSFLSDKFRIRQLIHKTGERKFIEDLCDKYTFYHRTYPYFKREAIKIGGGVSFQTFLKFVRINKRVFVKPISASFGQGAHIITDNNEKRLHQIYQKLAEGEWIIEECIDQSREMAEWNQSSVNTVRIPCFLTSEGFKVLNPFFRAGRKGNVIDNGGGGGIFACLDERTGEVISDGFDENNQNHEVHPDSKLKYKGWSIPHWNELLNLSEKIFRECFPDHKYIGFDFALTDKGWVLIEGNWGQFLGQYALKQGIKEKFIEYLNS